MTRNVNDKRTRDAKPMGYLVVTDSFLSGWGKAPARSLYALAYYSDRQADALEIAARHRSEMKRPRFVTRLRPDGQPDIRMDPGDHLTIVDEGKAAEWYKGAAANWVGR